MHDTFRSISTRVANMVGSIWAFALLIGIVGASGYYYGFSESWKVNVACLGGVVSLAVLILLQASQNHNDKATHVKLDELITASEGARNEVVSVEELSEKQMAELRKANPAERREV
jgi:low affinity Fe/Cu permease